MSYKSLKSISWDVTEEEYRADSALSYSTLSTYQRTGFEGLDTLFEKKESPSLTFGSAVDALITGGQEEFENNFMVADFPEVSDAIIKIIKKCFSLYSPTYNSLLDIPNDKIINIAQEFSFQNNWKPETRAKVIKEKGEEYYNLLYLAGEKTILDNTTYTDVLKAVRALKESNYTKEFFKEDDPFDNSIERCYQLKFKSSFHGIDYRCMADLLYVNHKLKVIQPIDLKTSSHPEWEFYKSFLQWNYQIQARLYYRIIRDNIDKDDYFEKFFLNNYKFIVVNRNTLTPLVWEFSETKETGELSINTPKGEIILKDPEVLGTELTYYLHNKPTVPIGINAVNDITKWIKDECN